MEHTKFLTTFTYTFLGLIVFLVSCIYTIVVSPIFLYRWIITKLVAPKFRPAIGKVVNVTGHFMATEFIPERNQSSSLSQTQPALPPPRCIIVGRCICVGTLSLEELTDMVAEGWLNKKEGESELRYPEFQQYLQSWMGFMFWKQDNNFSLQNHLYVHRVPDQANQKDSENILNNLVEVLMNKRFTPKRSPWEIHLLQNYKNPSLYNNSGDDGAMTVIIFRISHAMADGFSIMYAIVEGLFNLKLSSFQIAKPKKIDATSGTFSVVVSELLKKWVQLPMKILHDAGYLLSLQLRSRFSETPWHVPDSKKRGKTLSAKSELIPVEKIKLIKNHFDVCFTSVIMSCLASGVAESFDRKGSFGINSCPIMTILPLSGHPKKLRNHMAGTFVELNTSPSLDSVQRLRKSEETFLEARHFSTLPLIMWLMGRLSSSLVAPMAKILCKNKYAPAILSNFPGPSIEMDVRGRKCVGLDSYAGLIPGLAGAAIVVFSYLDQIRVTVTVEKGLMGREELIDLVGVIEREINVLYELALAKTQDYSGKQIKGL